MAIEDVACVRSLVKLCEDGAAFGWHEANGGNVSYRLSEADRQACSKYMNFAVAGGVWHELETPMPTLADECFLVTGAGKYLRDIEQNLRESVGIIQMDATGGSWRIIWGLRDGGSPTSELPMHLSCHAMRKEASNGEDRVVYHAHATSVIALSTVLPADARTWSRMLWSCMTECIIVFPQGLGVIPWMVPGSEEIAQATCDAMRAVSACVWPQHGIVVSKPSFEEAIGCVQTVDKAAGIYLQARAACGGAEPGELVSDEQLRQICERYAVQFNEEFLED